MTRGDSSDREQLGFVQIEKVGDDFGLVLPPELLAHFNLKEGDKLYLTEQTASGFRLSPTSPKHTKALEIARQAFQDYSETFHALAK